MARTVRTLASAYPDIATQWHPTKNGELTPDQVAPKSNKKAWWLCEHGHEWRTVVESRLRNGCPFCSGKYLLPGVSDLASCDPELAAQWNFLRNESTPDQVRLKSEEKVWWQCPEGHEWQERISRRRIRKSEGRDGCLVCTNKIVLAGFNDFATTIPALAKQWHPTKNGSLSPSDLLAGSSRKVWWRCENKHEWEATVYARAQRGTGCPHCANRSREVTVGYNDMGTTHPHLAAEWHPTKNLPLTPQNIFSGKNSKVWWRCALGHEWESTPNNRVGGKGCPVCAGRKVVQGFNDLATVAPEVAARWHPSKNGALKPTQVTANSGKRVWWRCAQKHEWEAAIYSATSGRGCPYCSGRFAVSGANDLLTTHPELIKEWHPTKNGELSPDAVKAGTSSIKIWWMCPQGHEWEARIVDRTTQSNGCPECSATMYVSRGEQEVLEVLRILLPNSRILTTDFSALRGLPRNGYGNGELDIYLPDRKFAVEFNGVYWHSDAMGRDKDYHANKSRACAEVGIYLYQVWEDDWRERRNIVIRGLAHRLGATHRLPLVLPNIPAYYAETVGARKCEVANLDAKTAREFLVDNHIQGFTPGSMYLGLVDQEGRLRAALVVKKSGSRAPGEYRIERYATAGTVSGGFTRLLRHAEKALLDATRWVTFADLSLSDGSLYEQHGFIPEKVLGPDYSYLVRDRRVHKFNYRLKRFREDPNLLWEEGLSERELAKLNGLHRIWDSGKVRYVKTIDIPANSS